MPHRPKLPSLTDYAEPERERTPLERARMERLFPSRTVDGHGIPLADRVSRLETVSATLVEGQIEAGPILAMAKEYINDETNARTSAMAMVKDLHGLTADIKRTQRVRESRTKLLFWAISAPVLVVIAGLWFKADVAALATAAAAVGAVAVAVVNSLANRQGQVRVGDSVPPGSN